MTIIKQYHNSTFWKKYIRDYATLVILIADIALLKPSEMPRIQGHIEQTAEIVPAALQICDCAFKMFTISASFIAPGKSVALLFAFCCCRSERSLLKYVLYFYKDVKKINTLKHRKLELTAGVRYL